jgi:hypothetical protein
MHCSHRLSLTWSMNFTMFSLRNLRQGSRFGEIRKTAKISLGSSELRFLRAMRRQ